MKLSRTAFLLFLFLTACSDETPSEPCTYPMDAPANFADGEPLPPFSWPTAIDALGEAAPLSMVEVACLGDPRRSWRDIEYLLFVSFPAWDPTSAVHIGELVALEQLIAAEATEIIWVLTEDRSSRPGTAEECRAMLQDLVSSVGLCVGDSETSPTPGAFDDSPLALLRGFEAIVRRSDMRIVFSASFGTPTGNDNLSGAQVLDALRAQRALDGS